MWKTVAKFVEKPVWRKFGYYQFYWAKLENEEGEFGCSFGKKLLENYSAEKKVCFLKCQKSFRGFRCQEIEFLDEEEKITVWEEVAAPIRNKSKSEPEEVGEKLTEIKKEKLVNLNEKSLVEVRPKFDLFEEKIAELASLLNEEQKRVFYLAVRDRVNLFFTGAAGTGKSFLLKKIITALRLLYGEKKVAVTALTGIAATNINGTTLHSFAGIGLGAAPLSELIQKIQGSKRDQKRWQTIEVLVIDEISMLSGDLLDDLEFIARTIRNNQRPFGGIQLIFGGDFFQLPPVSRDKKLPQLGFEAPSWKNCLNHSILLTKIHRQSENRLISLLNEIRFGEISPAGLAMLKELEQEPKYPADGIQAIQLYATNEEVSKINSAELARLPYRLRCYQAIDWESPVKRLSELLRNCLAPSELQLKLNAQVMLIKNLTPQLVNGSQGVIVDFQERKDCKINYYDWETKKIKKLTQTLSLPVVRFTNGIKKVIELAEWNIKIPYTNIVQASRQQIPLVLSWAITIHKSQGQSIERLKIDCRSIFAKGQLYVALSRATSVKHLQVVGFRENQILCYDKVKSFYRNLREKETSDQENGQQALAKPVSGINQELSPSDNPKNRSENSQLPVKIDTEFLLKYFKDHDIKQISLIPERKLLIEYNNGKSEIATDEQTNNNQEIIYEGKVIFIDKNKPYSQGAIGKGNMAWMIKVEPEIPDQLNINNQGRDKIYYAFDDYGELDIQVGKKYKFLIQKSEGWWQLEGSDKVFSL